MNGSGQRESAAEAQSSDGSDLPGEPRAAREPKAAAAAEAPVAPVAPVPADATDAPFDKGVLFDVELPTPAVRMQAALSPSRAGDFIQCPLMFRYRVVDKIPEPPSSEATRGTLVHAVLDRLFDLPAGSRTPDEAAALLGPQWDKLVADSPKVSELFASPEELETWLASAKVLLGRYFTLEDPNRLEPERREWRVRAVVGEGEEQLALRGIVDRLDVSPDGLLRVVDYKTGKAPKPAYAEKYLFQMKFYAVMLWRLRGEVPKRLQLIYLGSGEIRTYDPVERDLLDTEVKILAVWEAIRTAVHTGEWPARPTKLCGWCSFKPICPAHGGEAPPVPAIEIVGA